MSVVLALLGTLRTQTSAGTEALSCVLRRYESPDASSRARERSGLILAIGVFKLVKAVLLLRTAGGSMT